MNQWYEELISMNYCKFVKLFSPNFGNGGLYCWSEAFFEVDSRVEANLIGGALSYFIPW